MNKQKIKVLWQKYGFQFCLAAVFLLAFVIRLNNIFQYNTWWADDGGAHIMYIEKILNNHRLPTLDENYLAWHEPGYYFVMAFWTGLGKMFGLAGNSLLNWQEFIGLFLSIIFLLLIYYFSFSFTKNKWLALLNTFLFSFLFTSIKIGGYVNNELPVQLAIFGLAILFWKWRLLEDGKKIFVFYWALILSLAMMIKLTAVLILFVVLLVWVLFFFLQKKKQILVYILLTLVTVITVNLPWIMYKKENFNTAFSTNIHEQENKQSILKSDAWSYLFNINFHFVSDNPYWETKPHSFVSIFIADTFGNYYNLFNNVDEVNSFPNLDKFQTSNNRFTLPKTWRSNLWANRVGTLIFLIWVIGIIGSIYNYFKNKKINWYELFFWILLFGGLSALIYNNLRHPYLERGVLKVQFIYFIFPFVSIFAYNWWWQILKKLWQRLLVILVPILLYLFAVWPVIFIN